MIRNAVIAWLIVAGFCHAQTMSGPEQTDVGRSVWLEVDGISVPELQEGTIHVFPKGKPADIRILQDLRGVILIWFQPQEAGQFDLLIVAPYLEGDKPAIKAAEWSIQAGKIPDSPQTPPSPENPTQVTYVYEKDRNAVPRGVTAALRKLNDDAAYSGVSAAEFEEDTRDGDGEVPDQFKVALQAAKEAGLPALVIQRGNLVLEVIEAPETEEDVLEAIQ